MQRNSGATVGGIIFAIVAAALIISYFASKAGQSEQIVSCNTVTQQCTESTPIPVQTAP
jgi:hypothetical protein